MFMMMDGHRMHHRWWHDISLLVVHIRNLCVISLRRRVLVRFIFPSRFNYSRCSLTRVSTHFIHLQATATNATTAACASKGRDLSSPANVPMVGVVASAASISMNARVRHASMVAFALTKLQAMRAHARKSTPDRIARKTLKFATIHRARTVRSAWWKRASRSAIVSQIFMVKNVNISTMNAKLDRGEWAFFFDVEQRFAESLNWTFFSPTINSPLSDVKMVDNVLMASTTTCVAAGTTSGACSANVYRTRRRASSTATTRWLTESRRRLRWRASNLRRMLIYLQQPRLVLWRR